MDELDVGSIGRLMGEGGDGEVKRKRSGGREVGCFSQRSPSFPHKLALVIWGLASSRTLLNHLKKPLRHACTTQTSFRVNRASTPVTLRFFVATRSKLPLRVTSG